jgi:lantibiotic modifying enzyme
LSLWGRLPVLARKVVDVIRGWVGHCADFLTRLTSDRQAIRDNFGVPVNAALLEVVANVFDSHNGQRSVVICEFKQASKASDVAAWRWWVVYKPSDLS